MIQDFGTGAIEGKEDFSPLNHLWGKYDTRRFDWIIITHPHKDHINDIENLKSFGAGLLSCPSYLPKDIIIKSRLQNKFDDTKKKANNALFETYYTLTQTYPAQLTATKYQLSQELDGISVQQFCSPACDLSELNNHSVVTVLSYAGSKMLLPGDNQDESWKLLLAMEDFRKAIKGADILLAPHHGRDSAFYKGLFKYIQPRLTIISDGPLQETSAFDKYSDESSGMLVHNRKGYDETRRCVTTTEDGVIVVEVEPTLSGLPSTNVIVGRKS
jgi:competence protein ComEC